ncbi:hypothetical protein NQ318_000170 [Aromia moschata]|uniref:Uncharacterized protein n=1 Tax=Aromia moschata TaxID=1265417 RepID=A0AAV8YJ38_9CUCU|nr:hypothetical protein NQ318_000170 [Aromia moschata]
MFEMLQRQRQGRYADANASADEEHNQSVPSATSTPSKLPLSSFKYTPKPQPNSSIPIPRSSPRAIPQPTASRVPSASNPAAAETLRTYCTEDTPAGLSRTGSNSDLSFLSTPNDKCAKKDYLSDDSSNLSGDNDNILAECIQSGMPKARREPPKPGIKPASCLPRRSAAPAAAPVKYNPCGNSRRGSGEASKAHRGDANRRDNSLPPYLTARDELENYAVENSPCHYSLRSSLSDLTVDGSVAGLTSSTQGLDNQVINFRVALVMKNRPDLQYNNQMPQK